MSGGQNKGLSKLTDYRMLMKGQDWLIAELPAVNNNPNNEN